MSTITSPDNQAVDIDAETKENQKLNFTTVKSLLPRTFYLIFNLFACYFMQYVIITSFADTMGQTIKNKYHCTDSEDDL